MANEDLKKLLEEQKKKVKVEEEKKSLKKELFNLKYRKPIKILKGIGKLFEDNKKKKKK